MARIRAEGKPLSAKACGSRTHVPLLLAECAGNPANRTGPEPCGAVAAPAPRTELEPPQTGAPITQVRPYRLPTWMDPAPLTGGAF